MIPFANNAVKSYCLAKSRDKDGVGALFHVLPSVERHNHDDDVDGAFIKKGVYMCHCQDETYIYRISKALRVSCFK